MASSQAVTRRTFLAQGAQLSATGIVGTQLLSSCAHGRSANLPAPVVETAEEWGTDHRFGGVGAIYLFADPGDLWVEVEKQDHSGRYSPLLYHPTPVSNCHWLIGRTSLRLHQ